jgi:Tfp pilus assembly protein PilF
MDEKKIDELIALIFHFVSQEELVKGLSLLDRYIMEFPHDMVLRMFRSHALLMVNKLEEARAEGEIAREVMPDNYYLHNILGHVYWRLGKNYMAQESFEKAIELNAEDTQAKADYALFMVMERGTKLGYEAAENAVKNDPHSSDAWLALGIAQHRMHEVELFETSIRRSLSLDPENPQARILLLERLEQKGETSEAESLGKLMLDSPETRSVAMDLFTKKQKQEKITRVVENSTYLNSLLAQREKEVNSDETSGVWKKFSSWFSS